MAARPSWEGHLTFNLVSIPVKAFNAVGTATGKIGFHLLHAGCNERIRYKKVCPVHGEVHNDDIVSGYEYAKGQYVTVGKDEKGELKETDDKAIAIDTFVAPDAIDPIYFSGRTYYLVPNGPAAQKPYAVMMEAMRAHDRLGIARLVLSGRGQVAVVRPFGKLLGMTLLAFEDQVKPPAPFEAEVGSPTVSSKERALAEALLDSATSDFDLSRYKDDYAARLAKLVQSKTRRKLGRSAHPRPTADVGDLMDALRKSLAQQGAAGRRVRTRAGGASGPRRPAKGRGRARR
jgi:DNA end-binding protein Ku